MEGKKPPTPASKRTEKCHVPACTLFDVMNDTNLPDDIKVGLFQGSMSKAIATGDPSSLDVTSPRTRTLASYLQFVDKEVHTPQKASLRSQLVMDYTRKRASDTKFFQPPPTVDARKTVRKPNKNLFGNRKQAPKIIQHRVSCVEQSSNIQSEEEFPKNEKHHPTPLIDQIEEAPRKTKKPPKKYASKRVFSTLGEALDSLGPTAKIEKTQAQGIKGYFITLKCNYNSCKANWKVESVTDKLDSGPAHVFYDKHEHTCLDSTSWLTHYEHLVLHKREQIDCLECKVFMRKKGLPCWIRQATCRYLEHHPNNGPKEVSNNIVKTFQENPLMKDNNDVRLQITAQIREYVRKIRNGSKQDTQSRTKYFDDILHYINQHRVKYEIIHNKHTPPSKMSETWIRSLGFWLEQNGTIKPVASPNASIQAPPHRRLICLHDETISDHPRYKLLVSSKENVHKTGPDPLHRTIVFTSLALLCNLLYVLEHGYPVTAGVDGTHEITNTEYKLIPFGLYIMKDSGCRTFFPVAYAFGEGEREVCALHLFLNIQSAMKHIFGITNVNLRGGCVSDHAPVFINALKAAFPDLLLLQCFPHIIRAFMDPKERSGNGTYLKHMSTKDREWFFKVAMKDVLNLHLCQTLLQFFAYWALVKIAWYSKGESKMADTFEMSYIRDDNYNNWRYNSTEIHGCVPDNQPLESHNKTCKGTPDERGMIQIGRSQQSCLTTEFPNLVENCSLQMTGPTILEPVLDYELAFSDDKFMQFYEEFDSSIDLKEYKGGYLINDPGQLNVDITDIDLYEMELCLEGAFLVDEKNRDKMLKMTCRFHHVTRQTINYGPHTGTTICRCSCKGYWMTKRCYPSMYVQHRERLSVGGQTIPKHRRSKKITATEQHRMNISNAKRRKKERKQREQLSQNDPDDQGVRPLQVSQDDDLETLSVGDDTLLLPSESAASTNNNDGQKQWI